MWGYLRRGFSGGSQIPWEMERCPFCWVFTNAGGLHWGGPLGEPSEWDPYSPGVEAPRKQSLGHCLRGPAGPGQCLGDDLVTCPQTPGQKPDTLELAPASPVLSMPMKEVPLQLHFTDDETKTLACGGTASRWQGGF